MLSIPRTFDSRDKLGGDNYICVGISNSSGAAIPLSSVNFGPLVETIPPDSSHSDDRVFRGRWTAINFTDKFHAIQHLQAITTQLPSHKSAQHHNGSKERNQPTVPIAIISVEPNDQ
jgi:hypothetical protein